MADTNPGDSGARKLEAYWTRGAGLARWRGSPSPWTTLRALLMEHVNPELATRLATTYFVKVFGYGPGADMNRVTHGKPPRGKVVGPG